MTTKKQSKSHPNSSKTRIKARRIWLLEYADNACEIYATAKAAAIRSDYVLHWGGERPRTVTVYVLPADKYDAVCEQMAKAMWQRGPYTPKWEWVQKHYLREARAALKAIGVEEK